MLCGFIVLACLTEFLHALMIVLFRHHNPLKYIVTCAVISFYVLVSVAQNASIGRPLQNNFLFAVFLQCVRSKTLH